jgi:hypothetical protein
MKERSIDLERLRGHPNPARDKSRDMDSERSPYIPIFGAVHVART